MSQKIWRIIILLSISFNGIAQNFIAMPSNLFYKTSFSFGDLLRTSGGRVLIASSKDLFQADAQQISQACGYPRSADEKGNINFLGKNSNIFRDLTESHPGIKFLTVGADSMVYVVTNNNNIGLINHKLSSCIMMAPFNFQDGQHQIVITSIWISPEGTLFVGTESGIIYFIENATKVEIHKGNEEIYNYVWKLDKDSNYVVISGALPIKKFHLPAGVIPYTFSKHSGNEGIVLIGTNDGLYGYEKRANKTQNYFKTLKEGKCTITRIEPDNIGLNFWISTLDKGMAQFNMATNSLEFFRYPKKYADSKTIYPIAGFVRKSPNEFFVAVADSFPAIFNTYTGKYTFITDTSFNASENKCSDIEVDGLGMVLLTKGGTLYLAKSSDFGGDSDLTTDSSLIGPFLKDIFLGNENYHSKYDYWGRIDALKEITLKYSDNNIEITYGSRGMLSDSLLFAWKIDNSVSPWVENEYSDFGDMSNRARLRDLAPGKYVLRVRVKKMNGDWLKNEAILVINIERPFWQLWWFWAALAALLFCIVYPIIKWRINIVRKEERAKAASEKEMLELEAKALRAQMNPHFIFNCLNSIKAVIQKDEKDKAITYLTTFSKLIRTIFQNSDKREITLFDELETCRLYTELESLRFGPKFSFHFSIDRNIDLKSLMVPALIIQPFIENAIWHGLMTREEGGKLEVQVSSTGNTIYCIVDDNGIGRSLSAQNKMVIAPDHDSKGVRLTQTRLELSNSINQRKASVEIIDKKTDSGEAAGTRVVLAFNID